MARPCIFCGAEAADSKEHAIPDWMLRHFRRRHPGSTRQLQGWYGPAGQQQSFDILNGEVIAEEGVCDACNRGWMRRLEDRIIPKLRPLIDGHQVILPPGMQRILGRWCAKTAATVSMFHPVSPGIPDDHKRAIRDRGEASRLATITIGHYEPESRDEIDYQFRNVSLDPNRFGAGKAYLSTIRVGHFVCQIAGPCDTAEVAIISGHGPAILTIWPPLDPQCIRWPRSTGMDRTSFRRFGHFDLA